MHGLFVHSRDRGTFSPVSARRARRRRGGARCWCG